MELNETFVPLALEDLVDTAREYKEQGYQLAQMMGVLKEDDTVWLYYTFIKGNEVINRRIEGIIKGETEVPSLTPLYIAIFVNENEAHDLFGVNIVGNLIDFEGAFYRFAEGVEAPMSIVSPEQLAAREKAAKIAKAKAAKAAKAAKEKAAKEAEAAAPLPMLLLKSSPRSRPKQPALPRRRPQKLRRTRTRKGSNNGKSTSHSIRTPASGSA